MTLVEGVSWCVCVCVCVWGGGSAITTEQHFMFSVEEFTTVLRNRHSVLSLATGHAHISARQPPSAHSTCYKTVYSTQHVLQHSI